MSRGMLAQRKKGERSSWEGEEGRLKRRNNQFSISHQNIKSEMSNEKEKRRKKEKGKRSTRPGGWKRSARKGMTGDRKRNGQAQEAKRLVGCMRSRHYKYSATWERSKVAL